MTNRYQLLSSGRSTTADDPERGIWYASNFDRCGYWTDDWTKLKTFGGGVKLTTPNGVVDSPGVPGCPNCGCPGMQTTYRSWMRGAESHEKDKGKPHYVAYLKSRKEVCGKTWLDGGWTDNYEHFAKCQEEQS